MTVIHRDSVPIRNFFLLVVYGNRVNFTIVIKVLEVKSVTIVKGLTECQISYIKVYF